MTTEDAAVTALTPPEKQSLFALMLRAKQAGRDDLLDRVAQLGADPPRLRKLLAGDFGEATVSESAGDDSPAHALAQAFLDEVLARRTADPDADLSGLVSAFHTLLDDDELVEHVTGQVSEAGGYNEALHPRDDKGRYVGKDAIQAASTDPEAADRLRARVTNPAQREKLDAAIVDQAGTIGHTKRGQARVDSDGRRAKMAASASRARAIAAAVNDGTASKDDVRELADHLPHLTVDQLNAVANQVGGGVGVRTKGKLVESLRAALVDHETPMPDVVPAPTAEPPAPASAGSLVPDPVRGGELLDSSAWKANVPTPDDAASTGGTKAGRERVIKQLRAAGDEVARSVMAKLGTKNLSGIPAFSAAYGRAMGLHQALLAGHDPEVYRDAVQALADVRKLGDKVLAGEDVGAATVPARSDAKAAELPAPELPPAGSPQAAKAKAIAAKRGEIEDKKRAGRKKLSR